MSTNLNPNYLLQENDFPALPFTNIRLSRFFLWLPFYGVLISTVLAFFDITSPVMNRHISRFIKDIILLDAIHLAFTFGIIFGTTPGKNLVLNRKKLLSTKKGLLLIFLTIGILYFGNYVFKTNAKIPYIGGSVFFTFFWIWAIVPVFHTMRQSYGVGLLINKQIDSSGRTIVKKDETLERRLLNFNFACIVLCLILTQYPHESIQLIKKGFIGISVSCILFLLYNISNNDSYKGTSKLLFTSRFLLWPLIFISPIASYFVIFMHAQEYLFIFLKILKAKNNNIDKKQAIIITALFIMIIAPLSTLALVMGLDGMDPWDGSTTIALTFLLLPLITLLHYVLDSFIYRMKDPDVSATIGKAII